MNLLKESRNKQNNLRQTSLLANVLYISVFTLQPDGESTESFFSNERGGVDVSEAESQLDRYTK